MEKTGKTEVFDDIALAANFSALLYLAAEQNALIGNLIDAMLDNGLLNVKQLNDITKDAGDAEALTPVYRQLHKNFIEYYSMSRIVLEARGSTIQEVIESRMAEKENTDG